MGGNHLAFLRQFLEYHFGIPYKDWLRVVMNRIDPVLFEACFTRWVEQFRCDAATLIAIDVKSPFGDGSGMKATE